MRTMIVVMGMLGLVACGDPVPFCEDPGGGLPPLPTCGVVGWETFCEGGYDPDTGLETPDTTVPACSSTTRETYCASGATPRCELNPLYMP